MAGLSPSQSNHKPLKETPEDALRRGVNKLASRHGRQSQKGKTSQVPVDDTAKYRVKESQATVVSGPEARDPSGLHGAIKRRKGSNTDNSNFKGPEEVDDEEEDDDEDDDDDDEDQPADAAGKRPNETITLQTAAPAAANAADPVEGAEPSFGELAAAHSAEPIEVEAAFGLTIDQSRSILTQPELGVARAPSANSLGTVLNQALKTNDDELLESCLRTPDKPTIRATVERMQPPLAATLLSKLAERMHRRPARAGPLMLWIQWTLVSHGGYLAGQPELMRQLSSLHDVLSERARGLQPLLSLKGKLDMLDAQMQLRKRMADPRDQARSADDANDEAVIYVEGQDDSTDDETDAKPIQADVDMVDAFAGDENPDDDDDDSDEMPTTAVNGVEAESDAGDSEDDDGSDSDDDDLLDDEAEEMEADTGDEVDDDEDDDLDLDDGESLDEGGDTDTQVRMPMRSAPARS
ncbi:MAG: Small subunit (SSU) processome component [Lichina confinis]|nr:MAG: Small subunit (SSU) processome component [Lichina confinis]